MEVVAAMGEAEAEKVAGAMAEVERAAGVEKVVEAGKEEAVAGKTVTTATLGRADPTAFLARRPLVQARPDASSL